LRGAVLTMLLLLLAATGLILHQRAQEEQNQRHAESLVRGLLAADIARAPDVIKDMEPYRVWVDPLLRKHIEQAAEGSAQKLHTSLALLPVDPGQRDYLYKRLLDAQPHEVLVLRMALLPHKEELLDQLWSIAEKPSQGKERQRLRAASALAIYDAANPRWEKIQDQVASDLVAVPAVYLAAWMDCLRTVQAKMVPPLSVVFRDPQRRETERSLATDVLADFAAGQPDVLADLLLDADEKQFAVLYPQLKVHREGGVRVLAAEIAKASPENGPQDARENLARRQANAAVTLVRLGRSDSVWNLLKHRPDPRTRSYLIHRLGPMGVKRAVVLEHLKGEADTAIRSALVLSLGEFDEKGWVDAERNEVTEQLKQLYRTTPDPGLHGAAGWLLRQWDQDAWLKQEAQQWANDEAQRKQRLQTIVKALVQGAATPHWYVNSQGQTFVVIPRPGKVWVGSPPSEAERDEDEKRHAIRLDRSFAIAANPVTVEQFLSFRKDHTFDANASPHSDCPINKVTWYLAAEYCNWLSDREGLPKEEWCYLPNKDGLYAEGMKLAPNYLHRIGYRLPTEAEWEYACRAETVTSRYYGDAEKLLSKYAWYMKNSARRAWRVGSLKPNDWGLFDMHGNVWHWCMERYKANMAPPDGRVREDVEDRMEVSDQELRVLRGGSFTEAPAEVRAARRIPVPASRWSSYLGFRLARTFR
jgi:formylglycine-generating enzyme required for sulfatase activity